MFMTNDAYSSSVKPIQTMRNRQQLIVQINIGKKGEKSELRLPDLNNASNIDNQIKSFIKSHGLKQTAFPYIKGIISKQISLRRQEIYRQSQQKCGNNCKCSKKMNNFEEKEKKILGVIALNSSKNNQSKSLENKSKVQHLSIKIISKQNLSKASKKYQGSFEEFNKSFLSNQKQNTISQIEINNTQTSEMKKSAQFQKNESLNSSNYASRDNLSKNIQHHIKLNQNSFQTRNSKNYSSGISLYDSQSNRSKVKSTKQRKEALMTPKKSKLVQSQMLNTMQYIQNAQALSVDKDHLKQQNIKIIKKILQSPLFPNKCVSEHFQSVMQGLFKKLTVKNPPQLKEIHSKYVSYQDLEKQQLQFMGILFQKLHHFQLNNLNYGNFRSSSLKYCWKELEKIVQTKKKVERCNN